MAPTEKITVDDIENAPTKLPAQLGHVSREDYNELLKRFGDLSEQNISLQEENGKLKREKNTAVILDDLIKPYAFRAFLLMSVYCLFVAGVLYCHAFGHVSSPLGDEVLKTLVGSTAVTVIGLVGMVLTGIFVGARK